MNILVVGSGIMGNSIAQVFAQAGNKVTINDLNSELLDAAMKNIRRQLKLLRENNLLTNQDVNDAILRINLETNLGLAVNGCDLVIEAIPEKIDLKIALFQKLEAICPENTIFATNTSGISINKLANSIKRKDKLVGMHFFMPAHLIPLVEVTCGKETAEKTVDFAMEIARNAGKKPVKVAFDLPGFIANRLQHALAREAMSLLQKGVASAEDIDEVVKSSLAIRLIFTGPLEQRDFNGLDTHLNIASYLYEELEDTHKPLKILSDKVAEGKLGIKTGEGFYDWRGKDRLEVNAKKNQCLIDVIKFLKKYNKS